MIFECLSLQWNFPNGRQNAQVRDFERLGISHFCFKSGEILTLGVENVQNLVTSMNCQYDDSGL